MGNGVFIYEYIINMYNLEIKGKQKQNVNSKTNRINTTERIFWSPVKMDVLIEAHASIPLRMLNASRSLHQLMFAFINRQIKCDEGLLCGSTIVCRKIVQV